MLQVFMLHNVKKNISHKLGPIYDYGVTEKTLETFLKLQKRKISINPSDLYFFSKKRAGYFLTFDDGYRDNLVNALPILERYNIPCIIFCTTGFIEGNTYPYEVELAEIIESFSKIKIPIKKEELIIDKISNKKEVYSKLNIELKKKCNVDRQKFMQTLANENNFERASYQKEDFLSWEEIVELSKHPLVTIGAHTENHSFLTSLSLRQAYKDIKKSKETIEAKIKSKIDFFSYPYGKHNFLVRNLVRLIGFKYAFSTEPFRSKGKTELKKMRIPRIDIVKVT